MNFQAGHLSRHQLVVKLSPHQLFFTVFSLPSDPYQIRNMQEAFVDAKVEADSVRDNAAIARCCWCHKEIEIALCVRYCKHCGIEICGNCVTLPYPGPKMNRTNWHCCQCYRMSLTQGTTTTGPEVQFCRFCGRDLCNSCGIYLMESIVPSIFQVKIGRLAPTQAMRPVSRLRLLGKSKMDILERECLEVIYSFLSLTCLDMFSH